MRRFLGVSLQHPELGQQGWQSPSEALHGLQFEYLSWWPWVAPQQQAQTSSDVVISLKFISKCPALNCRLWEKNRFSSQ